MEAKSAKAKGGRYENHLVEIFREQLDKDAHRTPSSGSGLNKGDIRLPNFNIIAEAKNAKQIALIPDYEQMKRQTDAYNTGILIIRHPKKPEFQESIAVLELGSLIELLRNQKSEVKVIESNNPKLKYSAQRARESLAQFIRELDK